jgi:hypothetical protein
MEKTLTTIDYDWLTRPTGDPFADVGGYVIKYLTDKHPEKDILCLIDYASQIYIDRWNAGLHMFFLNSTITQSAKGYQSSSEKKAKTKDYFESLINGTAKSIDGYCRILGEKTKLYRAGRENSILTGSGTFLNFHHNLDSGIMLSKEAIIRFFFVPLGSIMISDKMGIISSNQKEVVDYFVKKNFSENIEKALFRFALRSKYSNPSSALFGFIDDLIMNVRIVMDETKKLSLNLFHFTNFGASPHADIYIIPANVFDFYRICKNIQFENQWKRFIQAHYVKYRGHNATYNLDSNSYTEKVKEISGIEKSVLQKIKQDETLDFGLCQFGSRIDTKTNIEYLLFDTGELANWKMGKIYKKWKENNSDGNFVKSFTDNTKRFKENLSLVYGEEYFSFKWLNIIYDKLIRGSTIRPQILKWSEKNILDFRIIRIYQQIIIGMNTKTLDLIEKISDFIIQDESSLKKNISKIKISNNSELRSLLIKQIEINYKNGNPIPLVTLRDYIGYLFPDGTNWKEIRDLMLICIYQKLHENNIPIEIEDEDIEDNSEIEETNL